MTMADMNEKLEAPIAGVLMMATRAAGNFVARSLADAGAGARPDGLTLIGVGVILAAATCAGVMASALQRAGAK